jgi:phosphate acyltransferase
MGGDNAPAAVVEGAIRAIHETPQELDVVLVGQEPVVRDVLDAHPAAADLPIHVQDAAEVITMADSPTAAVKSKRNSSIHVGLMAHKRGEVGAFISAGNTGAIMAASLFLLGRVSGVLRPSVPNIYPTIKGECVALDAGTNVDCKPEHLVQFARMGSIYSQLIFDNETPSVGLLNIGEEPGKGNEQVKTAFHLLNDTPGIDFYGNVEGRDVMHHTVDVVVCDGFIGNVMLKFGEGFVTAYPIMVKQTLARQDASPEVKQAMMHVIKTVTKRLHYEEYGGTPLLGVAGNVLIGHGSSSPRAFERLILAAVAAATQNLADSIASVFDA